ncbi:MAG: hypothetical protein IJ678_08040, partial [Kiritimatiellae bacterium]|nr:hypothetical protein [Kiritimatiellia bacterium]
VAPPAETSADRGEAYLFRGPGEFLPTVVVDAPALPPSAIPGLERKFLRERVAPCETARVDRVAL